jgi:hypothetical protein
MMPHSEHIFGTPRLLARRDQELEVILGEAMFHAGVWVIDGTLWIPIGRCVPGALIIR